MPTISRALRSRRVLLSVAVLLCAGSVRAQEGADTRTFEPNAPGDRFQAVPDATVVGDREPWAGLSWDYAYKPRGVVEGRDEGSGVFGGAQVYAHAGASLAMWDRVRFELNLPLRLASTAALADTGGFALADTRLGTRATLWGTRDDPMAVGVGLSVWAPTGSESEGTGDGRARLQLIGIVSGRQDGVEYTGHFGFLERKKADVGNLTIGPALVFGGGAAFPLIPDRLYVGPELTGHVVIPNDSIDTGLSRSTPIESLMTTRIIIGKLIIGAMVGTGLTSTPGTSRLRVELGVATIPELNLEPQNRDGDDIPDDRDACPDAFGIRDSDSSKNGCPPPPPPPDRDGDAIADRDDACPDELGIAHGRPERHGCPSDRDDDSIYDRDDACPDVRGVAHEDRAKNGCPPDRDSDSIYDVDDACPEVPGVAQADRAKNGCPPDRDGDGIVDGEDACPDAAGPPNEDRTKHGCPIVAIVVDEIRITEKVHFGTRSARILPESDTLLSAIAAILREHPELLLVSIEGHTDSRDNAYYNKQLSGWRAAAVRKWLIARGGIDPKRLTSEGFGEERPIASNESEEGMAKNRRVEFHIKKRVPTPGPPPAESEGQPLPTEPTRP